MRAIAPTIRRSIRLSVLAGLVLTTGSVLSDAGSANPASNTKKVTHHWYQIGSASWYGRYFQGHETASGESYDMNGMTCAHRSLPLGTLLKVTNLRNHRTVVVRVNDRGPVPENRVVDLSMAAANFIGMGSRGTAPVRLDVVDATVIAQTQWPLPGTSIAELPLR
jgi:rare lipoprotein A